MTSRVLVMAQLEPLRSAGVECHLAPVISDCHAVRGTAPTATDASASLLSVSIGAEARSAKHPAGYGSPPARQSATAASTRGRRGDASPRRTRRVDVTNSLTHAGDRQARPASRCLRRRGASRAWELSGCLGKDRSGACPGRRGTAGEGFLVEPVSGHKARGGLHDFGREPNVSPRLLTRIYACRIELTSRPSSSSVVAPALRRSNIASSLASRPRAAATTSSSASGAMTTMPSASPTSQSPVLTVTSPKAIVPPISPGPDLLAPGSACPRAKTGNFRAASPSRSRTVPSMTSAAMPAVCAAVARTSPQYPRETSPATVAARTLPRGACATPACSARLSPTGQRTANAGPAKRAPGHMAWMRVLRPWPPLSPSVALPSARSAAETASLSEECIVMSSTLTQLSQ
jgi:hypothetical protein